MRISAELGDNDVQRGVPPTRQIESVFNKFLICLSLLSAAILSPMELAAHIDATSDLIDVRLNLCYTTASNREASSDHEILILAARVAKKAHRWQFIVRNDKAHSYDG